MCFKGTASRIGGVGFEQLASDTLSLHAAAYHVSPLLRQPCCMFLAGWWYCLLPGRPASRCPFINRISPPPRSTPQGHDFADDQMGAKALPHSGDYHFRAAPGSEMHMNDPAAIAALQAAATGNDKAAYKRFSALNTK